MPLRQRRVESAPAHSNHAWDRTQLLCHAAAVQNRPSAGLHCCIYTYADCLSHRGASSQHQPTATMPETDYICCATLLLCKTALQQDCSAAFTPMQIAFYTAALRVGISPQQACLRQIISAVPCCCCAKQPHSWTALLRLHLCLSDRGALSQHQPTATMPGTDYICCAMLLLCKTARLHCCISTYADCLSHRGASSQHQPTATMPETDYICCATLLLCKTALQQDCSAAFTPMQIAFYTAALRVGISPQQPSLGKIISAVPCCCCAKQPHSWTALLRLHLCLSDRGALIQHQPTATMPGTEHNCSVMLLLCKTALQQDCTAAFTPMQIAFYTEARRVGISPQQPSLGQIISFVPCCCCAKQP